MTFYEGKSSAFASKEVSLNEYHKLTSDYAVDIEWESPNANQEGHLLELKIEPSANGYIIWGEVTDDEDWKEGDRKWIEIANVNIRNPYLRRYTAIPGVMRYIFSGQDARTTRVSSFNFVPHKSRNRCMLARLIYLTEFDSSFRRKQKLSREIGNLVNITFDVLKVNRYDQDRFSNLRTLEIIAQRVNQEVGRSDLETVLLRQIQVKNKIDEKAYQLYKVEEYVDIIEQALKVVL
ncbi:MAG: hypothetical protein ACK6A9_19775 [Dolichospermum sp.]|jgi:hypothetical protein|nr:hypothetical protein [Anabaena sp. 49628_E55]